ncbi:MAG: transcriptional regulator [Deltaproteobacteria bacterium]|nr:MAG: transcriptional regulator [Deltaproteobacteria bacterium]
MSVSKRKPGKPAKKYSQAARLHDVIRLLETRYGASVDELAEECGVTRRTVYRDLKAIEEAGYPLVSEADEGGRVLYRFMTGFKQVPPITFSLEELMTLHLCRDQLAFLRGTPFAEDLDAIFTRIHSSLPPRSVAHMERIASATAPKFSGVPDYTGRYQDLVRLRKALIRQFRCRLQYRPARRESQDYLIDPYGLLFHNNALYLAAYAHNRKDRRLFLVDRIEKVELLEERFDVPEDFSPAEILGQSFGVVSDDPIEVRVRFAAPVAHLIRERTWHSSQQLTETGDGGVELAMTVAGRTELLAWLYSYLPHVEVLSPPGLRREFFDGLRRALELEKPTPQEV